MSVASKQWESRRAAAAFISVQPALTVMEGLHYSPLLSWISFHCQSCISLHISKPRQEMAQSLNYNSGHLSGKVFCFVIVFFCHV